MADMYCTKDGTNFKIYNNKKRIEEDRKITKIVIGQWHWELKDVERKK